MLQTNLSPETAPALSAFAHDSFCDTFAHLYRAEDLAQFLAEWNQPEQLVSQMADPGWAIAISNGKNGAINGFVKMGPVVFDLPDGQPLAGAVELHQLYVASDAKGTGVAKQLMDWGLNWARPRAQLVYLSVFTENQRAQAFYRRYGFVDVGRYDFQVGSHIDEDRIWRLDL